MKAAIIKVNNKDKQLEIIDSPDAQLLKNKIKVKVIKVPLTTGDVAIMNLGSKKQKIVGQFYSGEVVSLGRDVNNFKVGDRVCGMHKSGTLSEYISVSYKSIIHRIPDEISYEASVALLFGGSAALYFLKKTLNKNKKMWILINGASGEVGLIALQLMKTYGHHVTAVSRTGNFEILKKYGADRCIDYTEEKIEKYLDQFDVVFDAVGKLNANRAVAHMSKNSEFITTHIGIGLISTIVKNWVYGGIKVKMGIAGIKKSDIETLFSLYSVGGIKEIIDNRFELEEVNKALDRVRSGAKVGTVIIDL